MRNHKGASRRKIYGVFDLGRVPLLDGDTGQPVATQEPEPTTLDGYIRREERRQQAKVAAEQKATNDAARVEYDKQVAAFYSQPSTALAQSLTGMKDNMSGLTVGGEGDIEAGQKFVAELESKGLTLSNTGRQRLAAYLTHQSAHSHGAVAMTVENIRLAFERLKSLGVFTNEMTESRPEPTDIPVGTDPILRSVIRFGMVDGQWQEMFQQWREHVSQNFHYRLNDLQCREAWLFIKSRGLNPLTPESWNAARRSLVSRSLVPLSLLTAREVLQRQLDDGEIDAKTFVQRCRTLEIEGKLDRPRDEAGHS